MSEQTAIDQHPVPANVRQPLPCGNATMTTLTYHNDPEFKLRCVEAAKHHRDADRLRAGIYGEMNGEFHGCDVGCDAYDITGEIKCEDIHRVTADYFGFPEWLEHLRDRIFEGLPEGENEDFHVRLKEAVPVGVDLEPVRHKLAIRRLNRLIEAQAKALDNAGDECGLRDSLERAIAAMQHVRSWHEAESGHDLGLHRWSSAGLAGLAWSAGLAAGLEWSVELAPESAAESADWSASSLAWSAAESADWSAASLAWSAAFQQEANDLIELLEAA